MCWPCRCRSRKRRYPSRTLYDARVLRTHQRHVDTRCSAAACHNMPYLPIF
ncbi:hypothetical protein PSPO01_16460 [Paraphaeosphaeria sporulosa]